MLPRLAIARQTPPADAGGSPTQPSTVIGVGIDSSRYGHYAASCRRIVAHKRARKRCGLPERMGSPRTRRPPCLSVRKLGPNLGLKTDCLRDSVRIPETERGAVTRV
jgi:hypothetical protein